MLFLLCMLLKEIVLSKREAVKHVSKKPDNRLTIEHPVIDSEHAGQRLDNFLFSYLKAVPKSHVYRIIRRGEVRVNKCRAQALDKLRVGDIVRVPVRDAPAASPDCSLDERDADDLHRRILFEDERLLVINKAVGEVVHAGSRHRHGLVDRLNRLRPDDNIRLLHRIDRGTTGCLLFAKSRPVMLSLHKAFRERAVKKVYLALVAGRWKHSDKLLLTEDRVSGKQLETMFRIKREYPRHTLLEARPVTGRTHQIRIQTAACDCPIVGDRKYGRRARDGGRARRLFLHAWKVSFELDKARYHFEAPTGDEWNAFIAALQPSPKISKDK